MSEYEIDEKYLVTESDVEQKIVWPLLTTKDPKGLGFDKIHIQTKASLKKLKIDKGDNAKLYYPDYVILIDGLPMIVVEAKKPDENLDEAYREARLYAHEINSFFSDDVNPIQLIIACNGKRLFAGTWDNKTPLFDIGCESWIATDQYFGAFVERFKFSVVKSEAGKLNGVLRTNVLYRKPTHLLGGKHIQNQQITNSFGETISIQYRHLFNPTNDSENAEIVKNAYVKVDKHLSHVDPIDRLIRKKITPSIADTSEVEDNVQPKEILDKLKNAQFYNNQVLLIIGSVGSGKSTFVSYLKEVALDRELAKKLTWVRLDLNDAPVNAQEIYRWLKSAIANELSLLEPEIDVETIENIKSIYFKEINAFNKVALELLGQESDKYKEKLFDKIQEVTKNEDVTLKAYIDFFVHRKHKELIVILDNCDKRNLEEQLLMFEVANWLKENIRSLVFLPLRETTFDHFRHQKPLDTVVKDLIFRINPPLLEKVIYNRIKYANRNSEVGTKSYILHNGIRVSYPSSEELYYLKSILKSLFQNRFFKKLLTGLAGRDIRKGIEFFLDFCKSGHITEEDIFKMKQSRGEHSLPNHIVSKVFLRGSRKYYSDSDTRIKNVFYCNPSEKLPNPFVRVAILNWLNDRSRIKGPSGILGFHKVETVITSLAALGYSEDNLLDELKTLIKTSLVISESQDSEALEIDELISINSPGIVHLELLNNVDYLSSCAEDVWYNNQQTAEQIANRISRFNETSHYSMKTALENSMDLVNYLENYSKHFFSVQSQYLAPDSYFAPVDFSKMRKGIDHLRNGFLNAKA